MEAVRQRHFADFEGKGIRGARKGMFRYRKYVLSNHSNNFFARCLAMASQPVTLEQEKVNGQCAQLQP